jgi:L-aminopeptidase/D-esterase
VAIEYKTGKNNSITDVAGVSVGHVTYADGNIQTGVSAIKAHQGNHFKEKLVAACHVMNGFGKSVGLVQIEELGQLETPIILTNTLAVGTCMQGLVDYMVAENPDIGRETGTVNAVIGECNDGYLNDIQKLVVTKDDVKAALDKANVLFERGAIGAGRGMSCYELKGGIGTASRIVEIADKAYTIGILVLSNFGRLPDLVINHQPLGQKIRQQTSHEDKGSIIVIVATDLPLDSRQLKRVLKRTGVGIARTGSYIGNGSGEIALGFSTANKILHDKIPEISSIIRLHEDTLEEVFSATTIATESAIIDSLQSATEVIGRDGNIRQALNDILKEKGLNE